MTIVTRFAPSPTGFLHLGHAYSALFAFAAAKDARGRFLLRIEDIDPSRCRPAFEQQIYEDMAWLGLVWDVPVRRQSEHMDAYRHALSVLQARHLTYPCFCTRKDIEAEIEAAGGAPHGPDGPVYPGTCRHLSADERSARIAANAPHATRLDMDAALSCTEALIWHDLGIGERLAVPEKFGDVVLARKDTPTSYHLAVTLDDHLQGVTLVTRGMDLVEATDIHRLLQSLLDLDVPTYHHHPLLLGPDGRRFAKRDQSQTLKSLRDEGVTAEDIKRTIAGMLDA